MDHEGYISLTDSGMEVARRIYTRHKWLTKFLVKLGVNEKTAEADACKMEHDVSDETFRKLREHAMENLKE
jgi:Mn-dependent DtxR family transcriptional regulator